MGNNASSAAHHNHCSAKVFDALSIGEKATKQMSNEEIRDTFLKFQVASKGGDSINRRKFSDIMHQCFPRTHKVRVLRLSINHIQC